LNGNIAVAAASDKLVMHRGQKQQSSLSQKFGF